MASVPNNSIILKITEKTANINLIINNSKSPFMKKNLLFVLFMMLGVMGGNAQDVYSIIGWENWETDWDMTQSEEDENVYVLVKENMTLGVGTYEYKLRSNHNWEGYQLPADYTNFSKVIEEAGVYTLTFTANIAENTLVCEAEKTGEINPDAKAELTQVELRGGWNGWATDGTAAMQKVDDVTYTMTVDLTDCDAQAVKDGYTEFKLVVNGSWLGYGQLTLDAPAWVIGVEEYGNFRLKAPDSGFNSFTFTATWEPNLNAANGWTLKVEGRDVKPFVFDYEKIKMTPADRSKVDELYNFILDLGGKDYVIEVKEDAEVILANADKSIELYAGMEVNGQTINIGLEDKVTTPGDYTLDIPAGAITVNGVALDPLQFKYTVNDPEAANKEFYEQVYIDPAEGEVESLEDFRLYFPVTLSNSDLSKVSLTNTTTGVSYELGGFDMGKYLKVYTIQNGVTDPGEYEMVFAEGAVDFYYDGKFQSNVELKYHWTITGEVEQKYYIMGSFLDSFTWETELEMTQVNDTLLTCEYEYAVNFAEGQTSKVIEFKMRQGHNWNGFQLPAQGNEKYEFTEPGVYQLTFTADIKNYTLTCKAVKAVYTYTVAGAFLPAEEGAEEEAAFFGTMWDVENTANDLVEGDYDIYKLSFQNVDLKAGKILYKVVRNHSWDVNYGFGSENASYNVNEAARYNITFKFSPTKKVDPYEVYNLTVSLEKVERPVGDVNGDYEVGIGDIVAITNIMAEDGFDAAADLNGDGTIGIGDIIAVTNIMAGVEGETEPEPEVTE